MCPYMNGGSSLLRNDKNLRCTTRTKICARKDRTRAMKTMIAVFVDSKMCRCILILMVRGDESLGLLEPMSVNVGIVPGSRTQVWHGVTKASIMIRGVTCDSASQNCSETADHIKNQRRAFRLLVL